MAPAAVSFGRAATIRYMAGRGEGVAARLYERVNHERAKKGWTWARLQKETGVARSTVLKWRSQPNPPQPASVNAVSDALGIARDEALFLAGIIAPRTDGLPECTFEAAILFLPFAPGDREWVVGAHRHLGHGTFCHLLSEEEAASTAQSARRGSGGEGRPGLLRA